MQTYMISTQEEWNDFKTFVNSTWKDIDVVAFDIETNALEEVIAEVWGIGLAFQEKEAFYFPLRTDTGGYTELNEAEVVDFISNLLLSKKIIGHNLVYDTLVWKHRYDIELFKAIYSDTILMKHALDEEPPFGLKEIAVRELGEWADKAQQAMIDNIKSKGGTTTKANFEMWRCDTQLLGEYCCWDVMLTFQLFELFQARLEKEGLMQFFYEDEVMPLYREVTIPMKARGVEVDVAMFNAKQQEAVVDIKLLTQQILDANKEPIAVFEKEVLEKEYPVKLSGNFPKAYAKFIGLGITSTAKKVIDSIVPATALQENFKNWMQGKEDLLGPVDQVQYKMYFDKNPEDLSVFNLSSKHHLKWLFFKYHEEEPLSKTEKGEPQIDDAFLASVASRYAWVNTLRELNSIEKMKGTYLEGMVERTHNGQLYTSFLQFGTTSGRFASRNPNLQNAPAPQKTGQISDKYVNAIRHGIKARSGYKLIGSDFSSLEPHIAAFVSGDKGLIDIFVKGQDFYSAIAIKQFGLTTLSAFKDQPNYLGDADKATRDKTKTYSLAAFYGASGFRIAEVLKCSVEEADELLQGYMNAFPGIRKFIERAHYDACHKGYVKTIFGRVRHLGECKALFDKYGHDLLNPRWARSRGLSEERSRFKNLLNNAVNFQIQGTAGHIMNRAMLLTARKFKEHNFNAHIVMTIHDEQIIEVQEDQVVEAAAIIKWSMENAVDIAPIKLKATPIIGNTYGDCK